MFAADTTTVTDKYVRGLPTGVTLTDHSPLISPWVLLEADVDDLFDVSTYASVLVYNGSNDVATISANTDDTNVLSLPIAAQLLCSNTDYQLGCLEVLTKGNTGSVSIWGLKIKVEIV